MLRKKAQLETALCAKKEEGLTKDYRKRELK